MTTQEAQFAKRMYAGFKRRLFMRKLKSYLIAWASNFSTVLLVLGVLMAVHKCHTGG